MLWYQIVFSVIVTILTIAITYFYNKSATFSYIIKNPKTLISLIKLAPKNDEEKMNILLKDKRLPSLEFTSSSYTG